MFEAFQYRHPLIQALAATLFTWGVTALDAALVFVVYAGLVPESQRAGNAGFATMGGLLGFTVMMILDVALG